MDFLFGSNILASSLYILQFFNYFFTAANFLFLHELYLDLGLWNGS